MPARVSLIQAALAGNLHAVALSSKTTSFKRASIVAYSSLLASILPFLERKNLSSSIWLTPSSTCRRIFQYFESANFNSSAFCLYNVEDASKKRDKKIITKRRRFKIGCS